MRRAWELVGQALLRGGWRVVRVKGIIVDRRACELGPELDRAVGYLHGWWERIGGLELVKLVGDLFHGWWGRVRGFVSIDVGRWTAGVFVGGLRI